MKTTISVMVSLTFLSVAQTWCALYWKETAEDAIKLAEDQAAFIEILEKRSNP